ncbi:MAG: hypothetical protein PHU76_01780 [Synergistaceae bacterium]|nr:hypothetical protein [Proteiniphilum sp.]MDD3963170.1 hypothetical protein [Synergistaceae bacterium]
MNDSKIRKIKTDELRTMQDAEGLVLQGCGGDPQEWLDGINELLTEAGILKDGNTFQNIAVFEHDGLTNILFPFDGVPVDTGKLAMWRLATHEQFGGTWLSDYVPNRLGGFVQPCESQHTAKPDCPLIGEDGNVFNLIAIAARTLRRNQMGDQAAEMQERIMGGACQSYDEALGIIGEYVNITSTEDMNQGGMTMGGM